MPTRGRGEATGVALGCTGRRGVSNYRLGVQEDGTEKERSNRPTSLSVFSCFLLPCPVNLYVVLLCCCLLSPVPVYCCCACVAVALTTTVSLGMNGVYMGLSQVTAVACSPILDGLGFPRFLPFASSRLGRASWQGASSRMRLLQQGPM